MARTLPKELNPLILSEVAPTCTYDWRVAGLRLRIGLPRAPSGLDHR
jgi:hypothetical protein